MATLRVWDGGDNTDGTTWAKAYTTIENASVVGAAAGTIVWVAMDHVQTQATNLTVDFSAATRAAPIHVYSVDRADDGYSRMMDSTGSIEITGTLTTFDLRGEMVIYHGIAFHAGIWFRFGGGALDSTSFYDCLFKIVGSATNWTFFDQIGQLTYYPAFVRFEDCTFDWSIKTSMTTAAFIGEIYGDVEIINPTFIGATVDWDHVLGLFSTSTFPVRGTLKLIGGDYATDWAVSYLISSAGDYGDVIFQGCTLPATWKTTVKETGYSSTRGSVLIQNCDTGAISAPVEGLNYYEDYTGVVTTDTTTVRTGGASDGETSYSWLMAPTASAVGDPLRAPPITRWVAAGSQTITLYFTTTATLSKNDFYILLESPNETADPSQTAQINFETSKLADLFLTTELADGSAEVWTAGKTKEYKIDITITPTEPGICSVTCCLNVDSDVYVCPKLEIT